MNDLDDIPIKMLNIFKILFLSLKLQVFDGSINTIDLKARNIVCLLLHLFLLVLGDNEDNHYESNPSNHLDS